MGQQNDRYHGPHDGHPDTPAIPALVVYLHAIGYGEEHNLQQWDASKTADRPAAQVRNQAALQPAYFTMVTGQCA